MNTLTKIIMSAKSLEDAQDRVNRAFPGSKIIIAIAMMPVKLIDLKPGDRFVHAKGNTKIIYRVEGKPEFNSGHGSATRRCSNAGVMYNKSCRLSVIKINE